MIQRLGNVIYWAATGLAAIILVLVAVNTAYDTGQGDPFLRGVAAVAAVLVWLVGRAARYVLAGR